VHQPPSAPAQKRKEKEKTMLAVTATVSDSTAGISLEEAEGSNPTGLFSNKSKRQQNKSPDTSLSQATASRLSPL